jgi:hypothetical protein
VGVKHTTKTNKIPEMRKEINLINGKGVEAGVLKGEHAWLAAIHEYGLDIEVTPEMRAFLHRKGLHLKKTTTHIHIPERSFLRAGYDQNRDAILKKASKLLVDVTAGKMTATGCCKAVGLELASKIRDHAVDLQSPANHPFTIDQKGSSNPLVGPSGDMIGGITWRVSK